MSCPKGTHGILHKATCAGGSLGSSVAMNLSCVLDRQAPGLASGLS